MDINRSSESSAPGFRAKLIGMTSKMKSQSRSITTNARQSLRANPAKWAGIAAGVGLGLGVLGRVMRHRMGKRARPELVIIEAC